MIAEDVVHRHVALKLFFTKVLAMDDAHAETAACEMELVAPRKIITRIVEFIRFLDTDTQGGKDLTSYMYLRYRGIHSFSRAELRAYFPSTPVNAH